MPAAKRRHFFFACWFLQGRHLVGAEAETKGTVVNDARASYDSCATFETCASCTGAKYYHHKVTNVLDEARRREAEQHFHSWKHGPSCRWLTMLSPWESSQCVRDRGGHKNETHFHSEESSNHTTIRYEYDCPLSPVPYKQPPDFLPRWMGTLLPQNVSRFGALSLGNISLPGTHDSISYDLSLTVSEGGLDNLERLDQFLHFISGGTIKLLPGELEEFFRLQAKTQQLTITQQLDNGIRFIDFRLMYDHDTKEWYSIHFMQSRQTVEYYWKQIRVWLDGHPEELVAIWLSKDGAASTTGQDQYPNVTPNQKFQIWRTFQSIFNGMLMDTTQSFFDQTPIETMIQRGHRVVPIVSDYKEFTNSSPYALDAAIMLQNFFHGEGVFEEEKTMSVQQDYFRERQRRESVDDVNGTFHLLSLNTESPVWQIETAARFRFLPSFAWSSSSCAAHTQIPDVTRWCPETLLDIAQLASYYNQIVLETAFQNPSEYAFPSAFYVDALDYDGTIRTGTQTLFGTGGSSDTKYAYVDTIIAYNIRLSCPSFDVDAGVEQGDDCRDLWQLVMGRRGNHPLTLWDDSAYGRRMDWPPHPETATASFML